MFVNSSTASLFVTILPFLCAFAVLHYDLTFVKVELWLVRSLLIGVKVGRKQSSRDYQTQSSES